MKKILLLVFLSYSIEVHAEIISSHQIGNTTYFSNGTTMNRIGNTYYTNRGISYNKIGNTIYGSNGTSLTHIGNTYYTNDGRSYNRIGNTVYGSDGSTISNIGNTTYYSNSRYFKPVGYSSAIRRPTSTQTPQITSSNYDSGYSDGAAIAAGAIAVIAMGALIGSTISSNNKEIEQAYYNHLNIFERKVMAKRIY